MIDAPTLLAFWRQIAANPADAAPRLVFCDWLEEQAGEVRDEAGRRALEVARTGQRFQVAHRAYAHWSRDGSGDWWEWTVSSWRQRHAPWVLSNELIEGMRTAGRRDGMPLEVVAHTLTYRTIHEAEWALAVALDRQAWQVRRGESAAVRAGFVDYKPPAAPFAG